MPFTSQHLKAVKTEMDRLRRAIADLEASPEWMGKGREFKYDGLVCGNKESGAVRRASMDLTRALANLRRRA